MKSTDEIIIRHAEGSDLYAFRDLRLEALKNHPTAFGSDYTENSSKPITYWEERLKINSAEQAMFFAEQNTGLIGMATIVRGSSKKSFHTANIYGIYVKPDWRGNRIAEKLVRTCLNWAVENGIIVVKLAVVSDNRPAICCYERCGFIPYGTEPKALNYEGRLYDEYLMSIELTSQN